MFFYGLSDVGRRRQNNQDSFGYLKIADNAEVFVVCDGMGGANGGNVASEMSVNVFTEYLKNSLGNFVDSKTNLLVLPEDTDSLGPYATTAEFSFLKDKDKAQDLAAAAKENGLENGSKNEPENGPESGIKNVSESGAKNGSENGSEYESKNRPENGLKKDLDNGAEFVGNAESGSDTGSGKTQKGSSNPATRGDGENEADVKVCDDTDNYEDTSVLQNPIYTLLSEAVASANTEVYERSRKDESLSGMGTTLVAALMIDSKLYIASVGDSRIYLFCGGDMVQLTHDHSYVQYLVDIGQITPEQALTNPYRNIITRAVGNERTIEADTESLLLTASPSYILLCSDGLTNYLGASDIRDIVWGYGEVTDNEEDQETELKRKVEELIDSANEGGGGDNITALLVKYTG